MSSELGGNVDYCLLELLMIAKPYRSGGIGAEVVTALEASLRRGGKVRTILSAVQCNNDSAIAFWKKMGYGIMSDPEPQPDGTVTYRLRKELDR